MYGSTTVPYSPSHLKKQIPSKKQENSWIKNFLRRNKRSSAQNRSRIFTYGTAFTGQLPAAGVYSPWDTTATIPPCFLLLLSPLPKSVSHEAAGRSVVHHWQPFTQAAVATVCLQGSTEIRAASRQQSCCRCSQRFIAPRSTRAVHCTYCNWMRSCAGGSKRALQPQPNNNYWDKYVGAKRAVQSSPRMPWRGFPHPCME